MNFSTINNNLPDSCNSVAILPGAPWLIAHKSMLKVNKPYKITFNHQDYVIWKNNDGGVFALNNICPHMQAPLSDGWICAQRNTIACPFHALEFNGEGKLYREGKLPGKPITQPLDLIVEDDLIWTYGNHQPRIPVPNLIPRTIKGYQFLGFTGEKSIQAPFLKCLKINYDFNHAIATHREPFKFDRIQVDNYQENGFYPTLHQTAIRVNNSWQEIINNPALLVAPRTLDNHFEYSFPSTSSLITPTAFGELAQFFILYPETQRSTRTFVLLYIKPKNKFSHFLFLLLKSYWLKSYDLVVEQDALALETLYPEQKPKIRLPREEIMFYAEKLYREWNGIQF
ncbi:MAG: Rieske 2Fe-2S domain-containing protein [Pleurocapsa sp. MO_226.B13]|nr:Rieske 2Fe-2S domain-containing protein [Pleurocapsa sp. MO_226.B13]